MASIKSCILLICLACITEDVVGKEIEMNHGEKTEKKCKIYLCDKGNLKMISDKSGPFG